MMPMHFLNVFGHNSFSIPQSLDLNTSPYLHVRKTHTYLRGMLHLLALGSYLDYYRHFRLTSLAHVFLLSSHHLCHFVLSSLLCLKKSCEGNIIISSEFVDVCLVSISCQKHLWQDWGMFMNAPKNISSTSRWLVGGSIKHSLHDIREHDLMGTHQKCSVNTYLFQLHKVDDALN